MALSERLTFKNTNAGNIDIVADFITISGVGRSIINSGSSGLLDDSTGFDLLPTSVDR